MDDEELCKVLGDEAESAKDTSYAPLPNPPVLTEIPISNVQLHRIATGQPCTIGQPGETLAVRFMLRNSFKAGKSNFVVNNFMMQIIAVGKDSFFRKEDMAVKTKVQVVGRKDEDVGEELEFEMSESDEELF